MGLRRTLAISFLTLCAAIFVLIEGDHAQARYMQTYDDLYLFYNCPDRDLARICKYDFSVQSEEIILEANDNLTFSDRDMLVITSDRILFRCHPEQGQNFVFCTSDHDGQNIEKIESRVFPYTNLPHVGYHMNEQGDIVFLCSPYHDISIDVLCLIDHENPNGFRVLSPEGYNVINMDLNEHGDVIFSCLNLFRPTRESGDFSGPFNMCAINIDGPNFRVLSPDIMWVNDSHVSDSREFLFFCTAPVETEENKFTVPDYDICKVDQAGNLERNAKPRPATTYNFNAVDENRLAYWCSQPIAGDEEKSEYGFCRTTFDGSEYEFTPISTYVHNGYFAFSQTGLIAMSCFPTSADRGGRGNIDFDICVVDSEGNEVARVGEPPLIRLYPVFNR